MPVFSRALRSSVAEDRPDQTSTRRAALSGELAIVAVLVLLYDRIRGLADVRRSVSIHNGMQLLGLEHHLGIDMELPANLWLAAHRQLADVTSWYYQLAHLSVTLVVLVVCYLRRSAIYRSARTALIFINVVGLGVYWAYPVAPPRLLPGRPFVDVTKVTGIAAASSTSAPNPYAAMPSLHAAWAIWVAVITLVSATAWWVRLLGLLYPLATVAVIVSTGNHYLLDAVAGAVLAVVATAGVWARPLAEHRGVT